MTHRCLKSLGKRKTETRSVGIYHLGASSAAQAAEGQVLLPAPDCHVSPGLGGSAHPHTEQNLLEHGEAAALSPGPCSSYSAAAVMAAQTPAKTDTSRCQGFQATTK